MAEAGAGNLSASLGGFELSQQSESQVAQSLLAQCAQLEEEQASAVCGHFTQRCARAAARLVVVCQAAQDLPPTFGPAEINAQNRLRWVLQSYE
jgi:hypothetical protein